MPASCWASTALQLAVNRDPHAQALEGMDDFLMIDVFFMNEDAFVVNLLVVVDFLYVKKLIREP